MLYPFIAYTFSILFKGYGFEKGILCLSMIKGLHKVSRSQGSLPSPNQETRYSDQPKKQLIGSRWRPCFRVTTRIAWTTFLLYLLGTCIYLDGRDVVVANDKCDL